MKRWIIGIVAFALLVLLMATGVAQAELSLFLAILNLLAAIATLWIPTLVALGNLLARFVMSV